MILVSACLANMKTRYDGTCEPREDIVKLVRSGRAIPVCPEILGGLAIPREAAEIETGGGWDVLYNSSRVRTLTGLDVTSMFIDGARKVLDLAIALGVKKAILKSGSPSCGSGNRNEDGVTTTLLKRNGVEVISEDEFPTLKSEGVVQWMR